MSTQESLAEYFRDQARWREDKADFYPDDPRNANAALTLEYLAEHVLTLPDDDPRIAAVSAIETSAIDYMVAVNGLDSGLEVPNPPATRLGFSNFEVDLNQELTRYTKGNLARGSRRRIPTMVFLRTKPRRSGIGCRASRSSCSRTSREI